MNALGNHLLVEYCDCDRKILNDVNNIRKILVSSAIEAGATIIDSVFHLFNPHGVSGVVVIAESHLSIHTWPEYGFASVDIFTCGDTVDTDLAFELIKNGLKSRRFSVKQIARGILEKNGVVS